MVAFSANLTGTIFAFFFAPPFFFGRLSSKEITNGRWLSKIQGATKELVLSLGNAAEMSNRVKEYETAYRFALAAYQIGQSAPASEDIAQSVLDKNQRRADLAKSYVSFNFLGKSTALHCIS